MSYDRGERRRTKGGSSFGASGHRGTFGYWVPLALTVTAATVGLAAWIWSERKEHEDDSSEEEHLPGGIPPPGYASMSGGLPPGPGPGGFQGPPPGQMGMGPPLQGGFQGPPGQMGGGPPPGMMGGPPQDGGFPGPPPGMGGPPQMGGFQGPSAGSMGGPPQAGGFQRSVDDSTGRATGVDTQEENSLVGRMSGALKRTPSPSQSYDWATTKIAAGVAAAGAVVGGALSSIREGSPDDYEDHERWSEEANNRESGKDIKQGIKRRGTNEEFYSGSVEVPITRTSLQSRKRKSVAVVVSAVELDADGESEVGHHASILSHLPEHVDPNTTKVFVLIYAPDLKTHPLSPVATRRPSQSMASSFSNISQNDLHTPAQTPGDFPSGTEEGILGNVDPNPIDEATSLYKTLHNQASSLVERDSMILPFTSRSGHKHILRSLQPEVVYIQESLCGDDGNIVTDLSGWVKQTVVVIGDEGGHGGLVDTDDESARKDSKSDIWWQREERTGLGRSVMVVESLKIGDDWRRRVGEHD